MGTKKYGFNQLSVLRNIDRRKKIKKVPGKGVCISFTSDKLDYYAKKNNCIVLFCHLRK